METLDVISLLALSGSFIILFFLAKIDLEIQLLPNELTLGFVSLGIVFHLSTLFHYITFIDMAAGACTAGGILYIIRAAANAYYQDDTLGLGDVKLMAAAGLWLGPYFSLMALTAGAFAGMIHGLIIAFYLWRKTKEPVDFSKLSLPAGPGFILGIIIAGILKFYDLPDVLLS